MAAARLDSLRSEPDERLVERMARGDREALAVLYDRYAGKVMGLGCQVLGDRHAAEDLVHEVFLDAWRQAGQFDAERGSVATWLLLRARSRAIDRRRSAARRRTEPESGGYEKVVQDDPPADAERSSDQRRALAALGCLSEEELEVIVLGYFEGLSSTEIAERVGVPVGTVKSRTRSGLMKLRGRLGSPTT